MSRQKELLFFLISFLIVAASWVGGTRVIRGRTEEMRMHYEEIKTEYEARLEAFAKKEEYLQKAEEYNAAYNQMVSQLPSELSQEEQILFVADLEEEFDIHVLSISYSEAMPVYQLQTKEAGEEAGLSLVYSTLQFPIRLEYNEWKRLLDSILSGSDSTTIPQMLARFDMESGQVEANITLNQYALIKGMVSEETE